MEINQTNNISTEKISKIEQAFKEFYQLIVVDKHITYKNLISVVEYFFEFFSSAQHQSNLCDIQIHNGIWKFLINKKVVGVNENIFIPSNVLDLSYPLENNFYYYFQYSPLEADRDKECKIWRHQHNKIVFPSITYVVAVLTFFLGRFPNFAETSIVYVKAFTEKSSENIDLNLYNEEVHKYLRTEPHFKSKLCDVFIDKNQYQYTNEKIKFKEKYYLSSHNLPQNLMSKQQLLCRIYKAYPSMIRDMANCTLIGKSNKINCYYSYNKDLEGIDMYISTKSNPRKYCPVYCYSLTSGANQFRLIKKTFRHHTKHDIGIEFVKDLETAGKENILVSNNEILQMIEYLENHYADPNIEYNQNNTNIRKIIY